MNLRPVFLVQGVPFEGPYSLVDIPGFSANTGSGAAISNLGGVQTRDTTQGDGTIDWWCLPAFDGDIVFGALLDAGRGGCWRLGPRDGQLGAQEYVGKSGALRTRWFGDG